MSLISTKDVHREVVTINTTPNYQPCNISPNILQNILTKLAVIADSLNNNLAGHYSQLKLNNINCLDQRYHTPKPR
jgi:hypothetical protein